MNQYNREAGTSGLNQFDITGEDLREAQEQQNKHLEIDFVYGESKRYVSVVRKFPGLDAEVNEHELRRIANQLIAAAAKLHKKNNCGVLGMTEQKQPPYAQGLVSIEFKELLKGGNFKRLRRMRRSMLCLTRS